MLQERKGEKQREREGERGCALGEKQRGKERERMVDYQCGMKS